MFRMNQKKKKKITLTKRIQLYNLPIDDAITLKSAENIKRKTF